MVIVRRLFIIMAMTFYTFLDNELLAAVGSWKYSFLFVVKLSLAASSTDVPYACPWYTTDDDDDQMDIS